MIQSKVLKWMMVNTRSCPFPERNWENNIRRISLVVGWLLVGWENEDLRESEDPNAELLLMMV